MRENRSTAVSNRAAAAVSLSSLRPTSVARRRRPSSDPVSSASSEAAVAITLFGPVPLRAGLDHAGVEPAQLLATQPQPQRPDLGAHRVVPVRRPGLTLQRAEPLALLGEEIGQPGDVEVGLFQPPHRAVAPAPVLGDAGRLLDDGAVLVGAGVEDVPDLPLADQDVLVPAHSAVGEDLVEVEQPARRAVELVLGGAVAEQPPGHRQLVDVERQEPVPVVEGEGHLGPTQTGPGGGPGEDHVVHAGGAQRLGRLGPHHPGEGVDQVGLARPVRPDHDVDPGVELEPGPGGERLEADERQCLEEHGPVSIPRGYSHTWDSRPQPWGAEPEAVTSRFGGSRTSGWVAGWHTGQKWVPLVRSSMRSIGVPQRRQGSPVLP